MPARQGNNPKRRIVARDTLNEEELNALIREVRYVGSNLHKKNHSDYGFDPPANPRPNKSLCDGVRAIPIGEATRLFRSGLKRGMVSEFREGRFPKYVWAVDDDGEAYEAKLGGGGPTYHGYRLGANDAAMQKYVIEQWEQR